MGAVGWLVLGVLVVVAVTSLSRRVGVAPPLVLVVVGVAVSLLPFVPAIVVEPEIILGVVLPPLLYSGAVNLPAMDFRRDLTTISGLSVGLVVVSAVVVGLVATEAAVDHYGGAQGMKRIDAMLPLGRMAKGADIAGVVSFLASPDAAYVSGARIAVHGGGERPVFLTLASGG